MNKKAKLRREADKLWFQKCMKSELNFTKTCEICNEPAQQVHHFFPKSQFGHLRYNIDNGIVLCNACHFAHHSKGDPRIHQEIIAKRGVAWYHSLLNESRESPASYQTIGYYNSIIKRLK